MLICEYRHACLDTKGIGKSYFGCFNDGTVWKQLMLWLGKSYVEPGPPDILFAFFFHGMTTFHERNMDC